MDLRHLRYFLVLAEELHFRRAASRLAISQPPLSSAIRQMEEELGTLLFERDTKSVLLTDAGRALREQAQRTLSQFHNACDIARRVGHGQLGRLRLGFTGGALLRGLPALLEAHEREVPGLDISLHEMSSAVQVAAIQQHGLDGGFVHAPVVPEGLRALKVCEERWLCCLPQSHRLARRRSIELSALADERWILFARTTSPSYFDSVISLCGGAGFSPSIRHEVTHWISAVMMVSRQLGIALVPQAFAQSGLPGVCFLPLKGNNTVSNAYFVWRHGETETALAHFVARMRDQLRLPAD